VIVVGVVTGALGAPTGPGRYAAGALASLAGVSAFAAAGMNALVRVVAEARVPLARASAAMVLVLGLAIPVSAADTTLLALSKKRDATAEWNARVFGALPRGAVVFVAGDRLLLRVEAAALAGALPPDSIVLPATGADATRTARLLVREPLLAPVLRDLTLYGAPEEYSLSRLAASRPLFVAIGAAWGKRLARHFVPFGAFDRYSIEPRGSAERLEALTPPILDESTSTAAQDDTQLLAVTKDLLQRRAEAAAFTGERDYIAMAASRLTVGVAARSGVAARASSQ
jgi:hypothetical protein